MKRMFQVIAISFFLLLILFYTDPVLASKEYASDRVLVKYKSDTREEIKQNGRQKINAVRISRLERLDTEIIRVDLGTVKEKIRELRRDPAVEYAEPDYKAFALKITSDPGIVNNLQWGAYKIKTASQGESAWNYAKSNSAIKIAILDSGIDKDHKDLQGKIVSSNNCTNTGSVDDYYGHGTHVAGIVAAATNNSQGVAGIGYNALLVNAKVLGNNGTGYYSWIADCITWSADQGVKIINMSIGAPYKSKTLEQAIDYAWGKGVLLVAAAGNSGNSAKTYPAYYSNVLSVAATDQNDIRASFSSYGNWVDVAAPGVSIYSTFPNHFYAMGKSPGYGYASGTSMAAPHVAGLAALVWDTPFGGTNSKVRKQIQETADRIAGTGWFFRYGRVNALKAVTQELDEDKNENEDKAEDIDNKKQEQNSRFKNIFRRRFR